ncbi:MAG TPA: serine/threonine protein phosphatase [Bacteroidetes bacterium]|nr:serine/threonine protein phosphatase [Bacteroidota bacterium]HRR08386.1 metallophosphoesterase family protein [Rhodothermales bacterium]
MGFVAIGDVHGCRVTLEALLKEIAPREDDILVFIGDYIDRGPDSKGVIEFLLEYRKTQNCVFLRGNHEQMLLDTLDGGIEALWLSNGGRDTMDSYRRAGFEKIPEDHVRFIQDTLFYYEAEEFLFVHGGLKPRFTVAQNLSLFDQEIFLWERSHLRTEFNEWEKTVICGHTPQPHVLMQATLICIDTGCVFNYIPQFGTLSAIRLPERQIITIPNQESPISLNG